MISITKKALKEAAQRGEGLAHLTDIQVYAAVVLDIPIENLKNPLPCQVENELEEMANQLRDQFFECMSKGDGIALIQLAYDPKQPPCLALPIRRYVDASIKESFPEVELIGVNDNGQPLVTISSVARWLGMSEEDVWQFAIQSGLTSIFEQPSCHTLH